MFYEQKQAKMISQHNRVVETLLLIYVICEYKTGWVGTKEFRESRKVSKSKQLHITLQIISSAFSPLIIISSYELCHSMWCLWAMTLLPLGYWGLIKHQNVLYFEKKKGGGSIFLASKSWAINFQMTLNLDESIYHSDEQRSEMTIHTSWEQKTASSKKSTPLAMAE